MFEQLLPLLEKRDVRIEVQLVRGKVRVKIIPQEQPGDAKNILAGHLLAVTGTAKELDSAAFSEAVINYVAARERLEKQFAAESDIDVEALA